MSVESSLRRIVKQLDEFERLLDLHSVRHERLSQWSIANHVDHVVSVTDSVLTRLSKGDEGVAPGKPLTFIGRVVLWTGYIPRGRGKAPKATLPTDAGVADVRQRASSLRDRVREHLAQPQLLTSSRATFPHPYFGLLDSRKWVRFIEVHQQHHLKIVRDIASASLR